EDATDGFERGDVVPVAELHLQDGEARSFRRGGTLGHDRRLGDADRERRRGRLGWRQAEERAQWLAGGLRGAVMRQDVERARRRAAVREPRGEPRAEASDVARILREEIKRG